jgi:hypothetical protein
MMGSYPYYIQDQITEARKDSAPHDAIYKNDDGSWATFNEIKRADTKALIAKTVTEITGKKVKP